jgi:hypothetical protein
VHVAADVFTNWGLVDGFGVDAMQQSAGLLGALGRVFGQVAGDLAADCARVQLADVDRLAPTDAPATE